jgi:hypothetical protein
VSSVAFRFLGQLHTRYLDSENSLLSVAMASISRARPAVSRSAFSVAVLGLLPLVSAQAVQYTLLPGNLPSCATQCQVFDGAATDCVPPVAPVTNNEAYISCFCFYSTLAPMRTSSQNICAPTCSDSDWATIENWYRSLCGLSAMSTSTVTGTATSTVAAAAASTAIGQFQDDTSSNTGGGWYVPASPAEHMRMRLLTRGGAGTLGSRHTGTGWS